MSVENKSKKELSLFPQVEAHFLKNFKTLVKRFTKRAGTMWAAEDVVQGAYERAIRYYRPFPDEDFERWFSIILSNSLRDFLAAERGYSPIEDEENVAEEAPYEGCPHYPEEIMREVFDLILTKSEVQIEILSLHFKHELSATDISQITDYSYAKTHQIIQRFRNELRDLYG